jgi:DNA-binding XRE family transcriptional regulator
MAEYDLPARELDPNDLARADALHTHLIHRVVPQVGFLDVAIHRPLLRFDLRSVYTQTLKYSIPRGIIGGSNFQGEMETMGTIYIYGLAEPTTGEVRYVGRSANPENRLCGHLHEAILSRRPKDDWIYSLALQGRAPDLVILDEAACEMAAEVEAQWVGQFGSQLLNPTLHTGQGGIPAGSGGEQSARLEARERIPLYVQRLASAVRPPLLQARPLEEPPAAPTPDELIAFRQRHGLSQAQFAKVLGVHYSTVSLWESGRRVPRHVAYLLAFMEGYVESE